MLRLYSTSLRGVFGTHSNNCVGVFARSFQLFSQKSSITGIPYVLNLPQSLCAVIGIRIVALETN